MGPVTQLQAALRELDDALMVALVGAGKGGEAKRSYSKTMISCVNSLERELQNGLVLDCGNGTCTLTNEMLKDFSGFSCSVMTGNVWIGAGCEHSPLRSLYCWEQARCSELSSFCVGRSVNSRCCRFTASRRKSRISRSKRKWKLVLK